MHALREMWPAVQQVRLRSAFTRRGVGPALPRGPPIRIRYGATHLGLPHRTPPLLYRNYCTATVQDTERNSTSMRITFVANSTYTTTIMASTTEQTQEWLDGKVAQNTLVKLLVRGIMLLWSFFFLVAIGLAT